MIASGIDPGQSSALAVVALNPPRLVRLVDVSGVKWAEKMRAAIAAAEGPIWCEKMEKAIRGSAHARNHNAAWGLGRNVGRWEAMAHPRPLLLTTTSEWWAALPTRLTGKRGDGTHRIAETCGMVANVRPWIEHLPLRRQVDCCEAVLIAYAGALRGR